EIDFREVGDEHRPPPRVDDRSRRGERPRPEPAGQLTRPAPAPSMEEHPAERPVRFEDAVEQLAEIADESVIPPPPSEEEIEQASGTAQPAAESFPVQRITDDELPADTGERVAAEAAPQPTEAEAVQPETKPKRGR